MKGKDSMIRKPANNNPISRKLIIWTLVLLLLVFNVSVSINLNAKEGGSCISVTFDKLPMLLVNNAVLCVDGDQYNIPDRELASEIAHESIVATNTDLCVHSKDRWIDLYWGNVLVRRIYWETDHNMFVVYKASLIHWIPFSIEGDGLVFPSDELVHRLESLITTN